ncbi:MAG: helix-turn-helix domain-containing protein, partial [Methanoculleus sp.]
MLQAYKYRMHLSQEQISLLMHHIHACWFVYNHSLEQKIRAFEQDGKKLSCFDLNIRLPALKEERCC